MEPADLIYSVSGDRWIFIFHGESTAVQFELLPRDGEKGKTIRIVQGQVTRWRNEDFSKVVAGEESPRLKSTG
jgi:hypothetical protein